MSGALDLQEPTGGEADNTLFQVALDGGAGEGVKSVTEDMRRKVGRTGQPHEIKEAREYPETLVRKYVLTYLRENVRTVGGLDELADVIKYMDERLPYIVAAKCIDGRVHGVRSKRLPPRSQRVRLMRTDGNKADVGLSNFHFWTRINESVIDAQSNTPGTPAVFFAFAHTSKLSGKCAAHKGNDEQALAEAKKQARAVQLLHGKEVLAAYGMTNTDDMSHTFVLYGEDGGETEIDVSGLIDDFKLSSPAQVLDPAFLKEPVDDIILRKHTGDRPIEHFLNGDNPTFFSDLKISTALEAHMLKRITESLLRGGDDKGNRVVNQALAASIKQKLDSIRGLSASLRPALVHIIVGNIMYALFKRKKIEILGREQRELYLGHAEELICYGEGFQLHDRNKCLLVKPGRGDDKEALSIAKAVLSHNPVRANQKHPPIVHINEEVDNKPRSFMDIGRLKASLLTRANLVKEVFGEDVRILLTYSTIDEKLFYPVKVQAGSNGVYVDTGFDVSAGIQANARAREIAGNEENYVRSVTTNS